MLKKLTLLASLKSKLAFFVFTAPKCLIDEYYFVSIDDILRDLNVKNAQNDFRG